MPTLPVLTPWQLGQNLVAARKAKKLSQAELGDALVLSQSRVSFLESNPQHLSLQQLLDWCATLNLELTLSRKPSESIADSQEW